MRDRGGYDTKYRPIRCMQVQTVWLATETPVPGEEAVREFGGAPVIWLGGRRAIGPGEAAGGLGWDRIINTP